MILKKFPLEFHWQTQEPFLFCAHHLDSYPKGTDQLGPDPSLLHGRVIGQDFQIKDGFRMYHGETVPGFPVHPHRGFETVTLVRQGYVDHTDSLGAAGRYGEGDVQWMTGGGGIQHSEMFPLLHSNKDNPLELFQIWLNLPKSKKMSPPDFKMFWKEKIPSVELKEQKTRIALIAGSYQKATPLSPPEASWAYDPSTETVIWMITIEAGGHFEIPASQQDLSRSLYFFSGDSIQLGEEVIPAKTGVFVDSRNTLLIRAGKQTAEILLLQSKRIGEPVAQYGPFVMNTESEIRDTLSDYRRTQFGGWPWEHAEMTHGKDIVRFAKFPDGRIEKP